MLILLHIIIALCSIVCTTYAALRPSIRLRRTSYALVGLTLITGTYLVMSSHTALMHACVSGLAYIAIVSSGLLVGGRRLVG
jgi:hypothetical protein